LPGRPQAAAPSAGQQQQPPQPARSTAGGLRVSDVTQNALAGVAVAALRQEIKDKKGK
jgi:hypothetical protein